MGGTRNRKAFLRTFTSSNRWPVKADRADRQSALCGCLSWRPVNKRQVSKSIQWPSVQLSSVQLLSHARLFATPWITARQASLSITNSWSPTKPISIESVMSSNYLILCHTLLLLPSIFSSIKVFSHESPRRIRWLKYWSFSFSISPSNEYSGLISFRIDWFELLALQGTLRISLKENFWPCHTGCGILVPWLGINHWTSREVPLPGT